MAALYAPPCWPEPALTYAVTPLDVDLRSKKQSEMSTGRSLCRRPPGDWHKATRAPYSSPHRRCPRAYPTRPSRCHSHQLRSGRRVRPAPATGCTTAGHGRSPGRGRAAARERGAFSLGELSIPLWRSPGPVGWVTQVLARVFRGAAYSAGRSCARDGGACCRAHCQDPYHHKAAATPLPRDALVQHWSRAVRA